ncbi:MAG: hypothetical protein IT428_26130 [Planctomycetaceae bacterium]|nr:hypothetical protein [Planctomycetaceae bacterium]
MLTSPPYPNQRDFRAILRPENEFIQQLVLAGQLPMSFSQPDSIGSVKVKGKAPAIPHSTVARNFLKRIVGLRKAKRATYDDDVYYLPYFQNYFSDLERAYSNIQKYAARDFSGYIIVVNNTHRGVVIPVADFIRDIWQTMGYHAEVARTIELSHVGAKNPRARGIRASHTEYVIHVCRRKH